MHLTSLVEIFLINVFLQILMKLHSQCMKTVVLHLSLHPQSLLMLAIYVEFHFLIV